MERYRLGRWALASGLMVALALWIQWQIGWGQLLAPWAAFPLPRLAFLSALMGASYLVRAGRLYDLLASRTGGTYGQFLHIHVMHTAAINLLPMRLGEVVFPWLMHRHFEHRVLASASTLIWLRLLDLFCLLWLGALVLAWPRGLGYRLAALALGGTIPLGWWLHMRLMGATSRGEGRLAHLVHGLLTRFPERSTDYYRATLWTLCAWGLKLAAFLLVVVQISSLSAAQAVPGVVLAELSSSLPVQGLAGFGTYEAAMVLGLQGTTLETPQLLQAAVNLHLFLLGTSLLFALPILVWWHVLPSPRRGY